MQRAGCHFGSASGRRQDLTSFELGLKKTYSLNAPGRQPARLLDASKNDIRKYIKRERAKALPAGVDFWDFDCKLGTSPADANTKHSAELISSIDALVAAGAQQLYVEVHSKPGHRAIKPAALPEEAIIPATPVTY